MANEEIIVLLNDERHRKRRRFWVHPIVTRREEHGEFYRLVQELKMYHEPLGTRNRTIASSFRLGVSTVDSIESETCDALWHCLRDEHLPVPTEEMWRSTARIFHERWNFPNCLGAMDGKHIFIQAPANSVNADYRFLVVDVGSYGSNSDGGIFRWNSECSPTPPQLPGAPELGKVNYVIVADEAFPLKPYLLRPYPGRRLPTDKRIFNYRLSRARRISENAFGILSQRFRVFQRTLQVQPSVVDKVVKAACALCNYLCPNGNDQNRATEDENDCEQPLQGFEHCRSQRASVEAQIVRELYKEYFNSPAGEVAWQYDHVNHALGNR
uniref:DDE Tnp4 domain-containing protein n=1 Tax=Oryzias latipes TaxID=8090 RepID=A0A3P9IWX4_ORYLA